MLLVILISCMSTVSHRSIDWAGQEGAMSTVCLFCGGQQTWSLVLSSKQTKFGLNAEFVVLLGSSCAHALDSVFVLFVLHVI